MALISRFEERPLDPRRIHGEVLCGYGIATVEGRRIIQLETYGSSQRTMPGKVSQSIQLDEVAARDLKRLLERAFPGL